MGVEAVCRSQKGQEEKAELVIKRERAEVRSIDRGLMSSSTTVRFISK